MRAPKNKENASAGESANRRRKRRRDKLTRLDDLIPKKDVKGGRQLLFGATDTTQTTNPPEGKLSAVDRERFMECPKCGEILSLEELLLHLAYKHSSSER
jgi:hypothetical protein